MISRPDGTRITTASRSARARSTQQQSRNNKSLASTISIRSNHNVGLSQEVMDFNCQFVRCNPIGRTTAGALFFFITKNNRFTSLNFHKKMETTCRGLLCQELTAHNSNQKHSSYSHKRNRHGRLETKPTI